MMDLTLEKVNRLTMGLNECLLRPVVREGRIDFDILLPHLCEVQYDGLHITSILYLLDTDKYAYWDNEQYALLNSRGIVEYSAPNPYGVIPFVTFRREIPTDGYWLGSPGEDLVALYENQIIYRSYLQRIGYYQSFMQITKKITDVTSDTHIKSEYQQTVGPMTFLEGDYSTLDLRTDLRAYYDVTEAQLKRVAANWGISADVINQASYASGYAKQLASSSLLEQRRALIKLFRPVETELLRLITIVWNTEIPFLPFSGNPEPSIDYGEPSSLEDPREEYELFKQLMDSGLASPVDWIMKKNPDITDREAAIEQIKRNLAELDIVLEYKRSKQIPANQDLEQKTIEGMMGGRPPADDEMMMESPE